MGIRRGPNIVTDGLVFAVDAANPDSYVSGSTIWKGQTVNQNNGTLTNGPIFDSDNGGSIDFDGVDDYIDCGDNDNLSFGDASNDSPFSISAWIKIGQTTAQGIVTKYGSGSSTREYTFYTTGGKLRLLLWGNGTNNFATGTTTLSTDTWYHIACTYDGRGGSTAYNGITLYINAVAESVTTSGGSYTVMSNTSQPLYLGKENAKLIQGNIANSQIYNRALSATEVLQNYNALKTRFGL